MWIRGYVHETEDEAILCNVHIVRNISRYGGIYVGIMYLSNSNGIVIVKKHPSGDYNGQIIIPGHNHYEI